jgi:2-phosphosulfolactate phosphatase
MSGGSMNQILNVYALPTVVSAEDLAGGSVVVIDVLRASTTILHALEAGAIEVVPCLEIEEALARAAEIPPGEGVLGGERRGLPIEGFDLGNSPTEYTPYSVGGRTVVFTTTNGTRAMYRCRQARRVLIGAFVNASAVVERLLGEPQIHLLCAGSHGEITRDDVLLAGLLVTRIVQQGGDRYRLNAQAVVARENWIGSFPIPVAMGAEPLEPQRLADELRKSLAGQRLASIGLEQDILTAARLDQFSSVPELDVETLRIRLP